MQDHIEGEKRYDGWCLLEADEEGMQLMARWRQDWRSIEFVRGGWVVGAHSVNDKYSAARREARCWSAQRSKKGKRRLDPGEHKHGRDCWHGHAKKQKGVVV